MENDRDVDKYKIKDFPLKFSISHDSSPDNTENSSNGQIPQISRGLLNLSNTCYMNSVLQCLANTPNLAKECLSRADTDGLSNSLCDSFCEVVNELWSDLKTTAFSPRDFKMVVNSRLHKFFGYRQHDSHEFLTALLVYLSEPKETTEVNGSKSPKLLAIRDFYGEVFRTMHCKACDNVLTMTEEMWSFTIPLSIGENHDIVELLRHEMAPEKMTSENLPYCDKCKKRTNSEFSWIIKRSPKYLIFHLLRFTGPPSNSKINSKVNFKLNNLDLSEFVEGGSDCRYNLYGVINHYGSLNSGHYTAFCRSHKKKDMWFLMNDSSVSFCPSSSVVTNAAYLLFYEKID